jgi:hypothetical protein
MQTYLRVVTDFAQHFHRPPDQLGLDEIRKYLEMTTRQTPDQGTHWSTRTMAAATTVL